MFLVDFVVPFFWLTGVNGIMSAVALMKMLRTAKKVNSHAVIAKKDNNEIKKSNNSLF